MGPGTLHLPARGRGQRGRSAGAERHMSEGMLLPWGRSKGKAGARGQRGLPGWRTRCWEVRLDDPGAGRDARGGIGLDGQRGGSSSHLWSRQGRGDESAQMSSAASRGRSWGANGGGAIRQVGKGFQAADIQPGRPAQSLALVWMRGAGAVGGPGAHHFMLGVGLDIDCLRAHDACGPGTSARWRWRAIPGRPGTRQGEGLQRRMVCLSAESLRRGDRLLAVATPNHRPLREVTGSDRVTVTFKLEPKI